MVSPGPGFHDDSVGPIRVQWRFDSDTPPSLAIIRTIAAIENVDPVTSLTALGIRLHKHLNPEALDHLLSDRNGNTTVTIEFTLHNDQRYTIHLDDTGQLVVVKPTEDVDTVTIAPVHRRYG